MKQSTLFIVHSEAHPNHTMQETSIIAIHNLPHIGERQQEYLQQLQDIGHPSTDQEVADHAGHADPNYFRPRRNELVRQGIVRECDARTCRVTGRMAKTWWIIKEI